MAQTYPPYVVNRFDRGPFNPWTGEGDEDDSVRYMRQPGEAFLRPWLAVPNGISFVWPLGVEGFSLSIDPTLGIHKYIGDNRVKVDVMHKGEERISLSGSFPGMTGPDAMQALYNTVYADTPDKGKLLFVPIALDYTRRVTVSSARFDHPEDARGTDLNYSIEFVITDLGPKADNPVLDPDDVQQQGGAPTPSGGSTRRFTVTSKYNTLRKIAAYKKVTWASIFTKNHAYFDKNLIPMYAAPNAVIKIGTKLYY